MIFGFVLRHRRAERVEIRDSRLRAKARLRDRYAREKQDSLVGAGDSKFEESAFRGETPQASKPAWAHYFLDDRFAPQRPKPEELQPLTAEFTYAPAPGVEITIASPEESWDLWDKACAELHQDEERDSGASGAGPT